MLNHNLALKVFLLKEAHLCSPFLDQSKSHGQKERRTGMFVNRFSDYHKNYGSNYLFPDDNIVVSAASNDESPLSLLI